MRRFIYLDTDTLNSYIAQIYDGLLQSHETETQNTASTTKQNEITPSIEGSANLKAFGKGIDGKIDLTYRHLKDTGNTELISDVQTKLLHDNAFNQLIDYLNTNDLLSTNNIGDFIEIYDSFYIMDLDYYKKLFESKKLISFFTEKEEEKHKAILKYAQDTALNKDGANHQAIKRHYEEEFKKSKASIGQKYTNVANVIEMLNVLLPYRKTLCISNNMVVLNEKYLRDDIEMATFKYGGKIRVLGYITNSIGGTKPTVDTFNFAQIGASMNDVMRSLFTNQSEVNIVHPIAIYYE